MKVILKVLILAALLSACNNSSYNEVGGILVSRAEKVCDQDSSNHWLVDIMAKTKADSTYLNTKLLNRKIEIDAATMDKRSSVYKVLKETCAGDSVSFKLPADSFYLALGGVSPVWLNGKDEIWVTLWVQDKLNNLQYIAHKQVFEAERIAEYINNSKWSGQLDSTTEIYFELLKKNDKKIVPFKKAKFKYVIKSLQDNVLAFSKDEDPLVMDANDKSILLGIHFLSKQLAVGESLRAVLPSSQAFGPKGNSKVAGYMPIAVELELLEIIE